MKSHVILGFAVAAFLSVLSSKARAVEESSHAELPPLASSPRHDYLFPKAGHFTTSLATGVPFVALGELAYGVGTRFSFGAMGGATPVVTGLGIRPRGILFSVGSTRATLTVPIFYYPKTSTGDPWMLARPTLLFEHAFGSGARLSGGLGVIGAACTDSIFSLGREHSGTFMGGLWNTVAVGGAVPLSSKTSLFAEGTAILRGVRFAGRDWVGGPPFAIEVGVATDL
jgi:hypothetical protein